MRALRYLGPGRLAIEDMPVPEASAGEALVATAACGLCATDVKTYLRGHPKIPPGAVLGHEMAGTIVSLNAGDPTDERGHSTWHVGDRVAVPPYIGCGECEFCRSSRPTLCPKLMEVRPSPGGFAEVIKVPAQIVEHGLVALPDHVSFPAATFVEPLACVVHGFEALGLGYGDPLLVLGDGPMGQLHVEVGRVLGCAPIVLSGATSHRLQFARERADVVLDARVDDIVDAVRGVRASGAAGVAVCTGSPGSVATAMAAVRPGGVVNVFAGMPPAVTVPVDLSRVHYEEVRLTGTFGSSTADFSRAASLIADGRVEVSRYITALASLSSATEAFQSAAAYEGMKTVVVFD